MYACLHTIETQRGMIYDENNMTGEGTHDTTGANGDKEAMTQFFYLISMTEAKTNNLHMVH